ncbi:unnamed protein product [Prorocentrum cordatum]|uniref:cGMP-dependent protein kinase n=1 Tax=Prorocentrum cordatum TaxID=2364126 RepID=A0ABN9PWY8_9DINO|nr:unnamed protein product [Polarella glacialis]
MSCLGCLPACLASVRLGGRAAGADADEEFAERVAFLRSVPIFKKQLPTADIPRVAEALRKKRHREGEYIAGQGHRPSSSEPAFFLIDSGEASVLVNSSGSSAKASRGAHAEEEFRGTLCRGDHFGGGCLLEERPYVASLKAGAGGCTTLSISQEQFEELGLRRLKLPKRAAIYEGRAKEKGAVVGPGHQAGVRISSKEDEDFIAEKLKRNKNLRALVQLSESQYHQIAKLARRLEVEKDGVLYQHGDVGHDIYVVHRGKVLLVPPPRVQRSAEEMATSTQLAKRALRKQDFLEKLSRGPTCGNGLDVLRESVPPNGSPPKASGGGPSPPRARRNSDVRPSSMRAGQAQPREGAKPNGARARHRSMIGSTQTELGVTIGDFVVLNDAGAGRPLAFGRSTSHGPSPGEGAETQEVGRVVEITSTGRVVVEFQQRGVKELRANQVQLAKTTGAVTTFGRGESFGEVSMLYDLRRIGTCHASGDQGATLFAISKRDFKKCLDRKDLQTKAKLREWCDVLDEVPSLQQLLRSERMELAKASCVGEVRFPPGECCIRKGAKRDPRQWYVVASGSAEIYADCANPEGADCTETPSTITRGGVFGERSLMRKTYVAEVTILAGANGMVCLAFEEEALYSFQHRTIITDPNSTLEEYIKGRSSSTDDTCPDAFNINPWNLRRICALGEGAYAKVFLLEDPQGRRFAEKRTSKRLVRKGGKELQRAICNERDLLSICRSDFIIRLFLSYQDRDFVYMVEEAACGGTLEKVVDLENGWGPVQRSNAARFYLAGITAGLEHLHERHIIHRDIKPGNVLLSRTGYPKLCDLGFARFALGKAYTQCGTPEYMAPELIDFPSEHSRAVDWWAAGVLAFELLDPKRQVPWSYCGEEEDDGQRLQAIRDGQHRAPEPRLPPETPEGARSFVRGLLMADPRHRLGGTDSRRVRMHGWFQEEGFSFDAVVSSAVEAPWVPHVEEPVEDSDLAAASDRHECDDVFERIEDSQWGTACCTVVDGVFTAKRPEAFAVTKGSKAVRITKAKGGVKGVVRFGLTPDSNDSQHFEKGFSVAMLPGLPQSHVDSTTAKFPASTEDELSLCIEGDQVTVYQAGQKVFTLGKTGRRCMFAKVFFSQAVAIRSFEEPASENDQWEQNFKLPDCTQRLIDQRWDGPKPLQRDARSASAPALSPRRAAGASSPVASLRRHAATSPTAAADGGAGAAPPSAQGAPLLRARTGLAPGAARGPSAPGARVSGPAPPLAAGAAAAGLHETRPRVKVAPAVYVMPKQALAPLTSRSPLLAHPAQISAPPARASNA